MVIREDNGLFVVTNQKVSNSDKFRPAAIKFDKYGFYTSAPKGTTAFIEYWREEGERCVDGYTADDGEWIPGYFYFYLNYTPILKVTERVVIDAKGRSRKVVERARHFPDFWDSDFDYFMAVEMAEREGKHLSVIKSRGKGYSFKAASMLNRNFFLIRDSKSYVFASETEFLLKDGTLSKAWDMMDFLNEHTGWAKKRQKVNQIMHRRASYIKTDEFGVERELGYMSEIIGVSLKNDPQKARGKRAKLILWEEGGKFPNLLTSWQVAQPSVEQNGVAYGTMIAFGCVCEGTKIFTNTGKTTNIENLKQEEGILGYNGYGAQDQEIKTFREPYETECIKITLTSGKSLECSYDHPIIYSHQSLSKRVPDRRQTGERMKYWKWKKAEEFKVGDQAGVIEEVPFFGEKEMWNPRFIGWLIGDGSYGKDKTPRISNCEDEINNYLNENFDTAIEKTYLTKLGKKYNETRIKNICFRLRDLGIYGQVKEHKRLPELIWECAEKDVCELLGGLFDTDGYVRLPKNKTGYGINYSTAYFKLAEDIMFLLQKIGIHSKIQFIKPNPKNKKDKNGYYRVAIGDIKSLKIFADKIKSFPKEKQERLNFYKESLKDKFGELSKYIVGLRFERVVKIESIGKKKVYNLTASDTHTYIANGIVTHNTGGTEGGDYDGLKELFLFPDGYNILPFKNIWDDGGTKCGFFVPEYVNMYGVDSHDRKLMDEDGNTEVHLATRHALAQREKVLKGASDRNAIDRWIAEHPFNPTEACLQLTGNIFPKEELIRHLAYIRSNENVRDFKQVGDLVWDESGLLKWTHAVRPKDIVKYRLGKDDDKHGQMVIWEHPPDDPPYGLYIAACDPYDFDQAATSDSLGSVFIYKRFQNFESYYDTIVAEYTGRPDTVNEFYENVRKLVMYYNARLLYENEKPGLFSYFTNKNSQHLLADQPVLIKSIIKDSVVQRAKGIHMTTGIKDFAELKVRDWLNEEYEPGKKNLTKLLSEPLIEELISFNRDGNFDRVIAFMLIMIFKEELHTRHTKSADEENKRQRLFSQPLFADEYIPKFIDL